MSITSSIECACLPHKMKTMFSNLEETNRFTIYNLLGKEIKTGTISNNEQINVQNIATGIYFLRVGDYKSVKFVKE